MPLFRRRSFSNEPTTSNQQQPPDEYAARGAASLAAGDAVTALEAYSSAIDKLHTMYVMGGCRYRQPSPSDNGILEGFVEAAQTVKAERGQAAVVSAVQKASNYLAQIAEAASGANAHPSMYLAYLDQLTRL